MEKTDSVFARRLKEARLRAGLSQKQLGITAGMDEFSASPRINQYERGVHYPDYETAARLAKVLNVPTPFLFTEDNVLAEFLINLESLTAHHFVTLQRYYKNIK